MSRESMERLCFDYPFSPPPFTNDTTNMNSTLPCMWNQEEEHHPSTAYVDSKIIMDFADVLFNLHDSNTTSSHLPPEPLSWPDTLLPSHTHNQQLREDRVSPSNCWSTSSSGSPGNSASSASIGPTPNGTSLDQMRKRRRPVLSGGGYNPTDPKALAHVKEMIYWSAAMRPVNLGKERPEAKPRRKNVRISSDPQTVAARHRRERISERLRVLQGLVPGGTKMDTASMLDEAANYLKFLKSQVHVLDRLGKEPVDPNSSSSSSPTNQHRAGLPSFAQGANYLHHPPNPNN